MNTIFIEGTDMAARIADRMGAPLFKYVDYAGIVSKAMVDEEMAKKLFLTVLKTASEKHKVAVVSVDNSADGRDEARMLSTSILQKNIGEVSYVFFAYQPEWDGVEVIDGVDLLASIIKDQEVPFDLAQQSTTASSIQAPTPTQETAATTAPTETKPVQEPTYQPPITGDLI